MYKKNSFIVISDFHSFDYPIDIIKNEYVNKYEKIYILGDATDRGIDGSGSNGINLLISIMNLCSEYKDRIIYIPGNHDLLLYLYSIDKNNFYHRLNLYINGGANTCVDIDNLRNDNNELYNELITWLSSLPIQRYHVKDNQKYALAHALFNEKLYKYNPYFSLKDYTNTKNKKVKKMVDNILWFRKYGDDFNKYNKDELPSSKNIMVIGHTPIDTRKDLNLDLLACDGKYIKVVCVDGGIVLHHDNNYLLSFDGILNNVYVKTNAKKVINKELIKRAIAATIAVLFLGLSTCSKEKKNIDTNSNQSITSGNYIKKKIKKIN